MSFAGCNPSQKFIVTNSFPGIQLLESGAWSVAGLSLTLLLYETVYTGIHHNRNGWHRRFALADDTPPPTPPMVDATGRVSPDKWGTLAPSASNAAPTQQTTTLPYSTSHQNAYPAQPQQPPQTYAPPGQAPGGEWVYLPPNQYQPNAYVPSPPVAGSVYGAPPGSLNAPWPPSSPYGTAPMQGAPYTPYPYQPGQQQT
jgi:hypothetical protein